MPTPLVLVHVATGTIALLAGFGAIVLTKGGRGHALAGQTFFWAMLVMAVTGLVLSIQPCDTLNLLASGVTLYLVLTGWQAVQRKPGAPGRFERIACAAGAGIALTGLALAWRVRAEPNEAVALSVFASLALWGAVQDVRLLRRSRIDGRGRMARHLWRMLLALAIAAAAFFLGQQDEMPQWLLGPHLGLPPLVALVALVGWLWRLRARSPQNIRVSR